MLGRATLVFLAVLSSGCGSVYYAAEVNSAASRVEEARAVGAERWAPYEYYFAREHLREAQVEASEASYGDAAEYAQIAEDFAQRAIDASRSAQRNNEP
jgi:hypothetical protein